MSWGPAIADAIAALPDRPPRPPLVWVRDGMASGELLALGAFDGLRQVATAILRGDGPEFVIVAASGSHPAVNLVTSILPALEQLALSSGFATMRVHTARPGLVRKLTRHGWEFSETVMRRELVGDH